MMESNEKISIGGNEAVLDVIRRRSDTETWVLFRVPGRVFRKDLVYGVSYDIKKQEIIDLTKFTDTLYGRTHFWSEYPRYSLYGRLEYLTGIKRNDHPIHGKRFVADSHHIAHQYGYSGRAYDRYEYEVLGILKDKGKGPFLDLRNVGDIRIAPYSKDGYGKLTDLIVKSLMGNKQELVTSEIKNLESILEKLRTSHIDFSVFERLLDKTPLEYEHVSKDESKIPQYHPSASWTKKVVETATIHHPLETKITREFDEYRQRFSPDYTFRFQDGKEVKSRNVILRLQNPQIGKPCFILYDHRCATLLDEAGNTLGKKLSSEYLVRNRGTFKNEHEEEISYSFVSVNDLINDDGNKVGSVDCKGFIQTQGT